ncbi:MAG: TRAP transporter substrate-binding protein DctP [Gammaproteobacteria bacterium]|nr:TRAP transporter substrate-binding protein DctP [Gammaproteobacteria bacterium]
MNKKLLLPLLAILSLLWVIPAQALTLKIATLAPAGTSWMKEMKKGAKEIKTRTNGRVKIKFYPGGVMGNDQSVHRKIRINQLQGGAFSSSGMTQVDSSIQVLSLPLVFDSFAEVDHVRAQIDDEIKQHMADNGFIILGLTEGGFARFFSTKPINNLEQLRATKVWIPEGDELVQITYDALGINPIALPISDVFTGLQTGLIDTIAATSTGAIAFQWHSKVNYVVDLPVMYIIGVLAVSKKAFDKIKAEDQLILKQEMNKVFTRLDEINRKDNIDATNALQNQNLNLVRVSDQDRQTLKQLTETAIRNMIDEDKIDRDIVESMQNHLQAFRTQ